MRARLIRGGGAASGLFVVDAETGEVGLRRGRPARRGRWPRTRSCSRRRRRSRDSGPTRRSPTKVLSRRRASTPTASSTAASTCRAAATRRSARRPSTTATWRPRHQPLRARAPQIRAAGITRGHRPPLRRRHDLRPPPRRRRLRLRDQPLHRPALRPRLQLRLQRLRAPAASPPTRPSWRPRSWPRALRAAGIPIRPQVALGDHAAASAEPIADRPLAVDDALVNTTDVYSDNFFAEMLIKLLGARLRRRRHHRRRGRGGRANSPASRGSGVHAVDGSGLTRGNRASPRAGRRPAAGDARRRPSATTSSRTSPSPATRARSPTACSGTAAYGRCRVKTGTLTGVSNLSGYCFNPSGRVMVFSILMGSVGDLDSPTTSRTGSPPRSPPTERTVARAAPAGRLRRGSRPPSFSALASFEPGFSPATT